MFKLPLHLKQMGVCSGNSHRSGWPYALSGLITRSRPTGRLLLDDFVERTFQQTPNPKPWTEPWVGIFHHPQNLPEWFDPSAPLEVICDSSAFKKSLPHMRGCIALSSYLAGWLHSEFQVPTLAVKHPTEVPNRLWDAYAWESGEKRIVQVGWYLRNYRAIYQVDTPPDVEKIHLVQDKPWVKRAWARTDASSLTSGRLEYGTVHQVPRLSDADYDELLATSVVFLELFDTSANNAIVEAVARGTPVVVNKHPAVVGYLGLDYPLYYSELDEVAGLLTTENLMEANRQMMAMNRDWLSAEYFADQVCSFLQSVT